MAAAALGNMISDIAGVCFAENVEVGTLCLLASNSHCSFCSLLPERSLDCDLPNYLDINKLQYLLEVRFLIPVCSDSLISGPDIGCCDWGMRWMYFRHGAFALV